LSESRESYTYVNMKCNCADTVSGNIRVTALSITLIGSVRHR